MIFASSVQFKIMLRLTKKKNKKNHALYGLLGFLVPPLSWATAAPWARSTL